MPRLFEKFYRGTNREALAERGTGWGWPSSNPLRNAMVEKFGWRVNWAREVFFIFKSRLHNQKNLSPFNKSPPLRDTSSTPRQTTQFIQCIAMRLCTKCHSAAIQHNKIHTLLLLQFLMYM